MPESTLLSGKVLKRPLPAMNNPADAGALATKRLLLPQGELAQFHNGDDPIRYIAFIELREGSVRGNHYHKFKDELIYVIQGEVELVVEDIHSKTRETVLLQAGDLTVIQRDVAHALRPVKPGQAIEFSRVQFNPADTHRYPLG